MPSGGFRIGAGRKKSNLADKKLEGRPQPKPQFKPQMSVKPMPVKTSEPNNVMSDYLNVAMKECEKEVPSAEVLRREIEDYINARGCCGVIAPQTITDYVLNRQGFLACECMNRKIGRMTRDLKLSPYVTAGAAYYKAMQGDFNIILQAINRYGGSQHEEQNAFLTLLQNKGF